MDRSVRARQRAPQLTARYVIDDLLGESAAIEMARQRMRRFARSDATVLIRDESGTGKELAAQGIHNARAARIDGTALGRCAHHRGDASCVDRACGRGRVSR